MCLGDLPPLLSILRRRGGGRHGSRPSACRTMSKSA
jgi:hypothetical protein